MHTSIIGAMKSELDTPLLCIDLDVMESNIGKMADFMHQRNVQWRPHQKCHKTPAIAHREISAGAIGVTCAKVTEAEVMAAAGIHDILIANMLIGRPKLERVAALCRSADPIVACDHYVQAEQLSQVCSERGVECRMIIEVDIGLNRVGVRPGKDTLELAQGIDRLPGVRLAGIMGYEGHTLTIEDPDEKRRQINDCLGTLLHCRDRLLQAGLCCDIVSAGGTGSYQYSCDVDGITEMQAGGGIFADPLYQLRMGVVGLDYALTVHTSVVSRPQRERVILDSGRKTLHPDLQMPLVKNLPDIEPVRFSAEHGELRLGPNAPDLQIGDKLELIVGYADFTTVLHDAFYAFRNDRLEAVWPILGRGRLR